MRSALLTAAVLLSAGCVNVPDDGGGTIPATGLAGYALACDIAPTGASGWTEPCLALASPNDSPSKSEIDLAVNPADPNNIVVASKDLDLLASKCVWAVAQVSKDGGQTWTTSYIGGKTSDRAPTDPLFGWNCITDPIMAFNDEGTLFYSLQAYDHTLEGSDVPPPLDAAAGVVGSAIFAARSSDGGLTWEKIVPLHVGDGANIFHDYMRVLVNPATGTYHTIWNQFTGVATVVPVLVSWDGTSEKGNAPVYIPIPDRPGGTTMAGFASATDGTLYVLLDDGTDGWLTTSTDDGRTFSPPVMVEEFRRSAIPRQAYGDGTFRTTGSYELVVDNSGGPRDGTLYATISHCEGDLQCDIFVTSSADGGEEWSEPILVNQEPHKAGLQWMPRPWVDPRGNLHLVYFDDSRDDSPERVGKQIDLTWALSTDAGATFNSTYLTATPFDGNLGIHQDGFPFIGDYNGIGGAGDHVYMGFPTTVTGRAEIAVAKVQLPAKST